LAAKLQLAGPGNASLLSVEAVMLQQFKAVFLPCPVWKVAGESLLVLVHFH